MAGMEKCGNAMNYKMGSASNSLINCTTLDFFLSIRALSCVCLLRSPSVLCILLSEKCS